MTATVTTIWSGRFDHLVVHCKRDPEPFTYVGRPSPLGNPFSWKKGTLASHVVKDVDEAIARFEEMLTSDEELILLVRSSLKGERLGCWCRPKNGFDVKLLCHAQVIAELANREEWP